jgi:ABC-type transport system involved in multi-copper enzyme maturation permease subunit
MLTGGHGVRMQDNFTNDVAGAQIPSTEPHWLRLTRAGDTVTGYESTDGRTWIPVGTAQLTGNPATVHAGMFVASPEYEVTTQQVGGTNSIGDQSQATAAFDNVDLEGGASGGEWTVLGIDGEDSSGSDQPGEAGGNGPDRNVAAAPAMQQFVESDGTFTMTGSGDIAPAVAGPGGNTIERGLVGVFAGLVAILVVSTSFVTAEFRRGLIRTTFIASPRRGWVLAAKAVVLGTATFVVGLVSALIAVVVITQLRRSAGGIVLPVSLLTEVRVVVGTAALLALAAVFALAVGTILRRSAAALTVTILLTVLPYLLAVASVLPADPAQWLLRITPAAGFAVTQSTPEYAQVDTAYLPSIGFFPLAPWAGFAVLCIWTALALGLANVALQRRDA